MSGLPCLDRNLQRANVHLPRDVQVQRGCRFWLLWRPDSLFSLGVFGGVNVSMSCIFGSVGWDLCSRRACMSSAWIFRKGQPILPLKPSYLCIELEVTIDVAKRLRVKLRSTQKKRKNVKERNANSWFARIQSIHMSLMLKSASDKSQ